jgi:hypothetical protein
MRLFRKEKKEKLDIEFVKNKPIKLWLLEIPFKGGSETYWVSFARPTMYTDGNEIPYVSTSTWTAGRMRWDDLYLEFRDYNDGRRLTEWFQTSMDVIGYSGFKKNFTVEMIDPTSVVVEKWHMVGCMPTQIQHHQEGWDDDPKIGVTFSIDRAVLIL